MAKAWKLLSPGKEENYKAEKSLLASRPTTQPHPARLVALRLHKACIEAASPLRLHPGGLRSPTSSVHRTWGRDAWLDAQGVALPLWASSPTPPTPFLEAGEAHRPEGPQFGSIL